LPCLKTWGNKTIFIPKKFYDTKKNKFITFKQLFDLNLLNSKKTGLPVGLYTTTNDFKENNIEVISNTPDEIFNAFTEMELFIEKKLIMSKEDKELQEKFWKLYPSRALSNKMIISPNFLRKNLTLLDYNI
jgi:putative glycosyltransferase (TIGR04372 family)